MVEVSALLQLRPTVRWKGCNWKWVQLTSLSTWSTSTPPSHQTGHTFRHLPGRRGRGDFRVLTWMILLCIGTLSPEARLVFQPDSFSEMPLESLWRLPNHYHGVPGISSSDLDNYMSDSAVHLLSSQPLWLIILPASLCWSLGLLGGQAWLYNLLNSV